MNATTPTKSETTIAKKYFCLFMTALLFSCTSFAQESSPEMAETMRSNGKIYVVVLVLATIFAGLILYIIRLDKKISRIEKNKQ